MKETLFELKRIDQSIQSQNKRRNGNLTSREGNLTARETTPEGNSNSKSENSYPSARIKNTRRMSQEKQAERLDYQADVSAKKSIKRKQALQAIQDKDLLFHPIINRTIKQGQKSKLPK